MKARELKKRYLDFFKRKGHIPIPAASLIPEHDPTVLFTTAGMHPLVPFLGGQPHPLGKRLVNVQKCLRTDDLEEVGDKYHHTFFEMLGNWSLGDYFKKEAIQWSFEFLTKVLSLPLEKLAVTCFKGDEKAPRDEEAAKIWLSLGIPRERIIFLGKEDNWWGPVGKSGPCGPDTEMFYWSSQEKPPKKFDHQDKRWIEIWNDVFIEYCQLPEGKLVPLSQKNVDTGMGVERVTALLQGYDDNYRTELFWPLIQEIEKITSQKYENNKKKIRILADHLRAIVFLLGDEKEVKPGKVDQGYVLRRFIRRAIRYLHVLGLDLRDLTLLPLAEKVIKEYQQEYPLLRKKKKFILEELKEEEKKFKGSLDKGLQEFTKIIKSNKKRISGKDAFLLFQSFGFPLELTEELAQEKGLQVDKIGFKKEYQKHQKLSRQGAEKKFKGGLSDASEETIKLHTATHLLNEALRRILSSDIKQKGSNITPERLRFDFNFPRKLTPEEIKSVENEVNKVIKEGLEVKKKEMLLKEAIKEGAQAEFGARYPEKVFVYLIGRFKENQPLKIYSKEICMGPHVENTKQLGKFKIIKEEAVAAGIRRIKAVLE